VSIGAVVRDHGIHIDAQLTIFVLQLYYLKVQSDKEAVEGYFNDRTEENRWKKL